MSIITGALGHMTDPLFSYSVCYAWPLKRDVKVFRYYIQSILIIHEFYLAHISISYIWISFYIRRFALFKNENKSKHSVLWNSGYVC